MLGSYAPGQTTEKKLPLEEAPSGMLARGTYSVRSKFTDDDGHSFLDFQWSLAVCPFIANIDRLIDQEELGIVWSLCMTLRNHSGLFDTVLSNSKELSCYCFIISF
jgi:RHO protein GDP dissociation inhibitor